MPIFLESEIYEESANISLTPELSREFESYFRENKMSLNDLEANTPYILGTFTHNKVYRMKKVIEFILSLDENRNSLLQNKTEKQI